VRGALREAKKTAMVYHPTDTHWTDRGGHVTYTEICKRLAKWFPDIRPWSEEDFHITVEELPGDLGTMLGLGDQLTAECEVFRPREKRKARRVNYALSSQHPWPRHIVPSEQAAMENVNAKHRLLFYHDSFGAHGSIQEYFGEHFSRISFVPLGLDNDCLELVVEQEHPDVVMQEIVERKLDELPSPGP
jgi:alginate O-acetyltransferase complex protein AlgJ